MARTELDDIEELALCSCCKRIFDDAEREPKLLACKHYFCLTCTRDTMSRSRDVLCVHCSKRTLLTDGGAYALPTHTAVLALARRLAPYPVCDTHALPAMWCTVCGARACRACDHAHHATSLRPPREARAQLQREARLLVADLQHLAARQRDYLLYALDAATAVKLNLEAELATTIAPLTPTEHALVEVDDNGWCIASAVAERDQLGQRHAQALLKSRLDDLIRHACMPLDFDLMRRTLTSATAYEPSPVSGLRDPLLFLANYCMAQLFTRSWLMEYEQPLKSTNSVAAPLELDTMADTAVTADLSLGGTSVTSLTSASNAVGSPPLRNLSVYPLFYFNLEMNRVAVGRVIIEVRDDAAPRMAHNFSMLTTGELGVGYRGCVVFQCWENESIITGDFEKNNGRGGRSVLEEHYFMPDDTKMVAVRGAVGMRRSQKRHDSQGLVGSQFRIMLREIRNFSAIFAYVVEGIELVEQLSHTGDSFGKPHSTILIASCGKLN